MALVEAVLGEQPPVAVAVLDAGRRRAIGGASTSSSGSCVGQRVRASPSPMYTQTSPSAPSAG